MAYNIYPKQFRNARIAIEKNRCFVLMPFHSQFDLTYGDMKKYLHDAGYICNRADELFGSVPIMSNIITEILRSHFVIADLTGQNANVFYELGIAHSFKDAHNIILLAQSVGDIPFDIRHLSTIVYDANNARHLNARILKTMNENGHHFGFYEALQAKGVLHLISDSSDDFIGEMVLFLQSKLACLTDILNSDVGSISDSEMKDALDAFLSFLYLPSTCSSRRNLRITLSILNAILGQSESFQYAHEVVKHFFFENKLENLSVSPSEIIFMQSSLATGLAKEGKYFGIVMPWIIDYFQRSKSASVDLNRYSMEEFLLTSIHVEVNAAVINSLLHENYYVREHMADIVGEKELVAALDTLIVQLGRESNIYAASSMITALGKLRNKKAFPAILKWFKKNEEEIVKTKHFFILKHIYVALSAIDMRNPSTAAFQEKFGQHTLPGSMW
jgi:hypothetical protein